MASSDIVSTSNMWPNYKVGNSASAGKSSSGSVMGKDQFLKILITQLQNQDPMQPMEDKEFIAQMAQFSSVEQLMNIQTLLSQSLGSSSSLIGKTVSWLDTANTKTKEYDWKDSTNKTEKSGVVDSIIFKDGKQYAVVGKDQIQLSDIIKIGAAPAEQPAGQPAETPAGQAADQPAGQPVGQTAESAGGSGTEAGKESGGAL